jgi:hypothetical protein
MTLQETIKHLKDICKKENLDVDSNNILDNAVKIVISNNINKSKKENIQNYQKTKINDSGASGKEIYKEAKSNRTLLASDKQKGLMTKLKIPFTKNTTISQAKELIELKLGKKEY